VFVPSLTLRKDPLTLRPSSFATIWVEGQTEIKKKEGRRDEVRLLTTRGEQRTRAVHGDLQ
jgi:hypothetical protein